VPERYFLSMEDEKAIYDLHQNQADDPGYRKFLARTVEPLLAQVDKDGVGLDFGCGPGPTLSKMLAEKGILCSDYDPYYFNLPRLLEMQYDFITMTEVIEHVSDPRLLFQRLDSMLKPGAVLAIMTKRIIGLEQFKTWHYKNDPTHICFYSDETFQRLAQRLNWRLEMVDKDVVFLYK